MDRKTGFDPSLIPRIDVLGVRVSAVNMDMAVACFGDWIDRRARQYVCVTGVHGVIESQDDSELRGIHNRSGLTTPDGMPLVWCSRVAGASWVRRVYGPDLMLRVCQEGLTDSWSHFFYGAAPGVAEDLGHRLKELHPGLNVVGTYSPPYRELSEAEAMWTAEMINDAGPDIVWVGLSTPKQERWMARFRPLLECPAIVGVGAAFDIHAGRLRQAPRWMQNSGLEWAFRLAVEPRRLWRRYLKANPRFLGSLAFRHPYLVTDDGEGFTAAP